MDTLLSLILVALQFIPTHLFINQNWGHINYLVMYSFLLKSTAHWETLPISLNPL